MKILISTDFRIYYALTKMFVRWISTLKLWKTSQKKKSFLPPSTQMTTCSSPYNARKYIYKTLPMFIFPLHPCTSLSTTTYRLPTFQHTYSLFVNFMWLLFTSIMCFIWSPCTSSELVGLQPIPPAAASSARPVIEPFVRPLA